MDETMSLEFSIFRIPADPAVIPQCQIVSRIADDIPPKASFGFPHPFDDGGVVFPMKRQAK